MGMGGAGVALAGGASSLFLNPAGLARLRGSEFPRSASAAYGALLIGLDDGNDLTQSALAYAQSPGVGFSAARLQAGRLYSESALSAGFGAQALAGEDGKGRLLAGGQLEALSWDSAPSAADGGEIIEDLRGPTRWGVSVGVIYTLTARGGIQIPLGFAARRLNRPDASSSAPGTERLPVQSAFGLGAVGASALWGLDIEMSGRDVDVRTGAEWRSPSDLLRLRGGFRLEGLAYGANVTFGIGLRVTPAAALDYAVWIPVGGAGRRPHRVSLDLRF